MPEYACIWPSLYYRFAIQIHFEQLLKFMHSMKSSQSHHKTLSLILEYVVIGWNTVPNGCLYKEMQCPHLSYLVTARLSDWARKTRPDAAKDVFTKSCPQAHIIIRLNWGAIFGEKVFSSQNQLYVRSAIIMVFINLWNYRVLPGQFEFKWLIIIDSLLKILFRNNIIVRLSARFL
jgi:hypothetical protein